MVGAFHVFFCDKGFVFELVEPSVAAVVGISQFCVEGYAAVDLDVSGLEVGVICHVVATAGVADYTDAWVQCVWPWVAAEEVVAFLNVGLEIVGVVADRSRSRFDGLDETQEVEKEFREMHDGCSFRCLCGVGNL